tara:strand:- start:50335 stop:50919 length:585 start_codon:yes stop_codon:yes gene_type:complete
MTDTPAPSALAKALPTKDRLIRAAGRLFRTHGYHGVGLNDILAAADAPKGSLYHHFPNGKSDLALAAATLTSDEILRAIAASFAGAADFHSGVTHFCHKAAKAFDLSEHWDGCPIAATLFADPHNTAFLDHANRCYAGWIAEVEEGALRVGMPPDVARRKAEHVFMLIEGAWHLARARRDSQVLRDLPDMLAEI